MTFQNFCETCNKKLIGNTDAEAVFNFIKKPEIISNLITFSDAGLPAISGIASYLESTYNNSLLFPLSNPHNRQQVGKMIKFILRFFAYETEINGLDERAQLLKFTNCDNFKTAAVYRKITDKVPQHSLQYLII